MRISADTLLLLSPGDLQPSEIPSGRRGANQAGGERRVRASGSSADVRSEHAEGCPVNVRVSRLLAAVRGPRHPTNVREKRSRYRIVRLYGLGVEADRQEQQPQQVRAAEGLWDVARHRHLLATHHL